MSQPTIFLSYSHQDETWKKRLAKHLGVLEREGRLSVWDDRRIETGDDWYPQIEAALNTARVAVLLISADFLTSGFILGMEVPRLLERRKKEGLRIVPVIARSCPWKRVPWLASIQALPIDGKALKSFRGDRVDEELSRIATEILDGLEKDGGTEAKESFLEVYRRCLSPTYSHWDLAHAGVAQAGGAGSPIEAKLDDMYLPLRLAEGFDLNKTDRGGPSHRKTSSPARDRS
jgi:TIR domain